MSPPPAGAALPAEETAAPTSRPLKRKIVAILAADVAGYSRLVAEDEERTLRALADARAVFDRRVAEGGGRIFNTAGDSVMCEFDSAVEAVRAAADIQAALAARNAPVEARRRLAFRIGITIGDVVERGGDLLGDGVNIAARLESLAPVGGICISRSVHESVANKIGLVFRPLGARRLKNIPNAVEAYAAEPEALLARADQADPLAAPSPGPEARPARRRLALAATAALALALAAGIPAFHLLQEETGRTQSETPAGRQAAAPEPAAGTEPAKPELGKPEPARPDAAKPAANEQREPQPAPPTPPRAPARQAASQPGQAAAPPRTPATAQVLASVAAVGQKNLGELYRSARLLEAAGDRAGALKAYAAATPLSGEMVDPPLRYATLLAAANGLGPAERAFADLARSAPASSAIPLAAAAIGEPEERRGKLEAFVAAHPENGPAQYLLAQALIQRRPGMPTLTERRLAFEALDGFLDAASDGTLAARFLDKTVLEGWVATAKTQRQAIESSFSAGATRPTASFERTSSGWLARLTLPEPATQVSTRLGERGELQATGHAAIVDPRTGQPMPVLEVELPALPTRRTLYVAYRDGAGHEAGPFPIVFDPALAGASTGRETLERYPESWVTFRPDLPDVVSFAGLVSNRCAIAKATIGFGQEAPTTELPLPACDAGGSSAMPSGAASMLTLPNGVEQVQVRLTYQDGEVSAVRTFRRP